MKQFISSTVEYFRNSSPREKIHDAVTVSGLSALAVSGIIGVCSMYDGFSLDNEAANESAAGDHGEAAALYGEAADSYGESATSFAVASVAVLVSAAAYGTRPQRY